MLAPGARYLITAAQFENARALSNGGERVTLVAGDGQTVIRDFTFRDSAPWPLAPDGGGPSLVLMNPVAAASDAWHDDRTHWRASLTASGTPGGTDGVPFSGNPGDNSDSDALTALVEYAPGISDTDGTSGLAGYSVAPDPVTWPLSLLLHPLRSRRGCPLHRGDEHLPRARFMDQRRSRSRQHRASGRHD